MATLPCTDLHIVVRLPEMDRDRRTRPIGPAAVMRASGAMRQPPLATASEWTVWVLDVSLRPSVTALPLRRLRAAPG